LENIGSKTPVISKNRFRVALAALLGLCASLANAQWAAYSSANFTLFSDAGDDDVLELLRDFEEYRRVALAVMGLPDEAEDQALKIVHLTRDADFLALGAPENAAGFFYHREFGPRIVIRGTMSRTGRATDAAAAADRAVLYHEYVHYLMDQRSGRNYPPWYREGIATVLMFTESSEAMTRVGMPLQAINWRSVDATVEDIVGTDYRGGVTDFYRMSWLLTHYLTIGAVDNPERRQQMVDYLRRYDAGEDPLEAFAASFGSSVSDVQRVLDDYRGQRSLKVLQVPRSTYAGEVSKRLLQAGEELYLLGDLAVELYASEAALERFDTFAEHHEDSPLRLKVMSRRAVALVHEDRFDLGDALVDEIRALNPDDGDTLADLAHYFHDRFQVQSRNADAGATESLEQSIRYGELAVARSAQDLEALFYLGRAYGYSGDFEKATRTLLRAFEQAPGADDINESLARVLYQSGNTKDAMLLISRNYSGSHSEEERERHRQLLQQMRDGNVDPEFLDP
jgi:tetratricopeptide (TPR) repeat protein